MPFPPNQTTALAPSAGSRADRCLGRRHGLKTTQLGFGNTRKLPPEANARCTQSTRCRLWHVLCLAILGWCMAVPASWAADLRPLAEHQLRALYLYNFTKYVEWPTEAFASTHAPFTIGLVCGPEIHQDLLELTKGKKVNGREILIRLLARPQDVQSCHMVFLEPADRQHLAPFLNAAKDLPVLTVGVSKDFLESGGIICLTRKEHNLHPRIDLVAARKTRLVVSAKLMTVAESVSAKPEEQRK